jgi:hypothetical protein
LRQRFSVNALPIELSGCDQTFTLGKQTFTVCGQTCTLTGEFRHIHERTGLPWSGDLLSEAKEVGTERQASAFMKHLRELKSRRHFLWE